MFKNIFKSISGKREKDNLGIEVLYSSVAPFPEVKAETKTKTANQIVEEIHETFYTEVDRLLASAKILSPVHTDKEELLEKKKKLEKLGFISSKIVQEGILESNRLSGIKASNDKKESLTETINYFSSKYPMYKFITEKSVKKICKKYNLVYSTVGNYIGDIPEKNIQDMLDFKIDKKDLVYGYSYYDSWEYKIYSEGYEEYMKVKNGERSGIALEGKLPLEICAPLHDFNQENMKVEDSQLVSNAPLDPIVLQPVYHNQKKHYLIVTAWGLEAEDPLVSNPIHN